MTTDLTKLILVVSYDQLTILYTQIIKDLRDSTMYLRPHEQSSFIMLFSLNSYNTPSKVFK